MLKTCENCNQDFLTEADPYVVVPTSNGYRYYCSCCLASNDNIKSIVALKKEIIELKKKVQMNIHNSAFNGVVWENEKMRALLKKIAGADYRGNRSWESVEAYQLLKELES